MEEQALEQKSDSKVNNIYGFHVDLNENAYHNAKEIILNSTPFEAESRLCSNNFHNLCTHLSHPRKIGQLLQLNMKFVPQQRIYPL